MAFLFLLSFIPAQLSAETNAFMKNKTTKNESAESNVLLRRLDKIKAKDKSMLNLRKIIYVKN